MKKSYQFPDSNYLQELPAFYYRKQDIAAFMEKATPWIQFYTKKALAGDPDVQSDFYLYFYERANRCLEKYKSFPHIPFAGFLAIYLKHEFQNFRRKKKAIIIDYVPVIMHEKISKDPDLIDEAKTILLKLLENLPSHLKLPIKLYYGLELSENDLKEMKLINQGYFQMILAIYHKRLEQRFTRLGKLVDRAANLHYQIVTDTYGNKKHLYKTKRNVEVLFKRDMNICRLSDLAVFFGISKTTLVRRIQKGIGILRDSVANEEFPLKKAS